MVTNNQIIESDGKRYRVQLIEIETPTYEMASEAGFAMRGKDFMSRNAYVKLKTLEHFYNGGEEGKFGVYLAFHQIIVGGSKEVFNFKDRETAQKFIEEQKELLNIFYQL
jgi:hypothetical protein